MWKKIDDEKIRHGWKCETCGDEVYVEPYFYMNTGVPMCEDCDEEMVYVCTEVQT